MKKFFAILTIGLLITSGLRAPESSVLTNGFCSSGPVLENVQGHDSDSHELRRAATDPMTLHSGFAPSMHPFDVPPGLEQDPLLPQLFLSDGFFDRSFLSSPQLLFRPPISIR